MAYFRSNFMDRRRQQWLRSIHAVEVQVFEEHGTSEWQRGVINQKKIEGDTLVIMATFPTLDSKHCYITHSRIIDVRGEVAAEQSRVIEKNAGQGVMIKLTIPIYEVTA